MSSVAPPLSVVEPHRLRRRVLALGQRVIESPHPPIDLLGEALEELRLALDCIQTLQAEQRLTREALSTLRAELEAGQVRGAGPPEEERSADRLDLLGGPLATAPEPLKAALRARITGALSLGTLEPGDRLPGVRELARQTGLNHKTVRRVYRALEESGLVEVRDRSGIYVSEPRSPLEVGEEEREGWIARFLVEAAERGFGADALPSQLWRWTAARPLQCACVESTEDDRFALCQEIGKRFGVETVPVEAGSEALAASLQEADLVVTTPFHAAEARAALAPDQPLVVVRLHADFFEAVQRAVSAAPCMLICVDPASGERLLHGLDARRAARVHVLSVQDLPEAEPLAECGAGILTLAARERLGGGDPPPHLSVPPYLSPRAAHEIACLLVRLNRAAIRGA